MSGAEIKLGPVRLPKKCRQNGELFPEQRHAIKAKTKASASCRKRNGWPEKGLVVCGPRDADLVAAEKMAMDCIVENEKKGKTTEENRARTTEADGDSSGDDDGLEWVHNKPARQAPPTRCSKKRTAAASVQPANAVVNAQQMHYFKQQVLMQQMQQQQFQSQFQLQHHMQMQNMSLFGGQMPMPGMPMPMPGMPMPGMPMSSMQMPGMPMPNMPMSCRLPPGLPLTSSPGINNPMWFARNGEEDEPRLNKPRKNKQQKVKEESCTSEDDDDDAANPFSDVPKGPQPTTAGLVQVKVEKDEEKKEKDKKKDAARTVEEDDRKKDATQSSEETSKKKDAGQKKDAAQSSEGTSKKKDAGQANPQEEIDSDIAEDEMHPIPAFAQARVLTPSSKARLVSAPKKTRREDLTNAVDMSVRIVTCGWRMIGAKYRHKFNDMIFDGDKCVLSRLEASFGRTIDTKRIAVYLDCRCFHSKASHALTPHLGKHIKILELIAADEKLIELFKEVILTIQVADEAGQPADMLLVCTSGIHRGPAAGLIIYEMLKRDGRLMAGNKPMDLSESTEKWRGKCSTCNGCTADGLRWSLIDKLYHNSWVPLRIAMYHPDP